MIGSRSPLGTFKRKIGHHSDPISSCESNFFIFIAEQKGQRIIGEQGSLLGIQRTKKSGFFGSMKRHEAGEDESEAFMLGKRMDYRSSKRNGTSQREDGYLVRWRDMIG